jgi:hypothetical protein
MLRVNKSLPWYAIMKPVGTNQFSYTRTFFENKYPSFNGFCWYVVDCGYVLNLERVLSLSNSKGSLSMFADSLVMFVACAATCFFARLLVEMSACCSIIIWSGTAL